MPRQPIHTRGDPRAETRVTGSNDLNQKALKVLAAIKYAPSSMSREDIAEKASLPNDDVERQTKLLLELHLVALNSRFPQYPEQGWKVYTKAEDHMRITQLLSQHGFEDPRIARTREVLGDYYPTGMDLEGDGKQRDGGIRKYPKGKPIIPELDFRPEAMAVMIKFRDEIFPFRPKEFSQQAIEEKKEKWKWFVKEMSKAYKIPEPNVLFGVFSQDSWSRDESSANDDNHQSSSYTPSTNTLFFTGKFSLATLLHEFGHARGFDERDTTIWTMNFGLRVFPVTFNRLLGSSDPNSHMLTRGNQQPRFDL